VTAIDFTHPAGELVTVATRKLWVEREGSGPPLVFLGGFGPAGSHVVFHPHTSRLADRFECVYVDLFGRGRSEHPADLHEVTFESDVRNVMTLLPLVAGGAAHIYGFSYGGLVAQEVALRDPSSCASLTLANSLHGPQMWQRNHENLNRELENQYPEVWEQVVMLRREGVAATDDRLRPLLAKVARVARFYDPDAAERVATEDGARNVDLYPLFAGTDVDFVIGGQVAQIPDMRPRLPSLAVPLMVLAGRFDRALYPGLQREFAQLVPHCVFHVLERSGCYGHVEEPEEVARLVRNFIGAL
jgi:proline iminopeptidase